MAKKFRFRLETVLKIKTEKVEEAKKQLQMAINLRYAKEREIAELVEQKQKECNRAYSKVKASEMQTAKDHINYLENLIIAEEKEKEKLIKIEDRRRIELNEAMKEEKIILKLKEKKLEEYNKDLALEETNFLNEIATQQHIKKETE